MPPEKFKVTKFDPLQQKTNRQPLKKNGPGILVWSKNKMFDKLLHKRLMKFYEKKDLLDPL